MYHVVFEGVGGEQSNAQGFRTWETFSSKEEFDALRDDFDSEDIVLEEGISEERAKLLVSQTSGMARAREAYRETAVTPELIEAMTLAAEQGHLFSFYAEIHQIRGEWEVELKRVFEEINQGKTSA